jgi:hypothetical protein
MICPNCQAKFNGFRMGKERTEHLIKCGNCDQVLIPTKNSFNNLQKNKSVGMSVVGLIYVALAFVGNKLLMGTSDWYFYILLILLAIAMSKFYIMFFKRSYEKVITFELYDIRQQNKCEID